MRVEETQTNEITQTVTTDVLCNLCGLSLWPEGAREMGVKDFYGLVEQTYTAGYFSERLEDGTAYTFSLCEACLKDLFDRFKMKPETNSVLFCDPGAAKVG